MKFPHSSTVTHIHPLSVCVVFCTILSCPIAASAAHPLITDDTGTMGTGKAQLEMTGEYGHDKEDGGSTTTTEGAASLSYGLSDSLDLVVGLPFQYFREKDAKTTMSEHGFSDASIEVKWGFYENNGLSFALKPGLTLPTGEDEKGLGTGKVSSSLFSIISKEKDPWAFHLNLGYIRNENTLGEEEDIWHASIASTLGVTEELTAVANIGLESNTDELAGTDPAFFLAGLIYALSEEFDIDCGIKYGINDSEPDYTVLAGIIWKF